MMRTFQFSTSFREGFLTSNDFLFSSSFITTSSQEQQSRVVTDRYTRLQRVKQRAFFLIDPKNERISLLLT